MNTGMNLWDQLLFALIDSVLISAVLDNPALSVSTVLHTSCVSVYTVSHKSCTVSFYCITNVLHCQFPLYYTGPALSVSTVLHRSCSVSFHCITQVLHCVLHCQFPLYYTGPAVSVSTVLHRSCTVSFHCITQVLQCQFPLYYTGPALSVSFCSSLRYAMPLTAGATAVIKRIRIIQEINNNEVPPMWFKALNNITMQCTWTPRCRFFINLTYN